MAMNAHLRQDAMPSLVARRYPLLAALLGEQLRATLLTVAGLFAALSIAMFAHAIVASDNLVTPHGPIIGGDFVVFWTAAQTIFSDNFETLYDAGQFEQVLAALFPSIHGQPVTWQYPPTIALFLAPLGAMPYLPAFFVWVSVNFGLFTALLSRLWRDKTALILAVFSPAVFIGVVTGQTGFLTATLLAAAAGFADKRPIMAGVATGLLTVKPQFGLLIPIAYAAAGCWRAFGAAAVTSVLLAGLSILIFGAEIWLAFLQAVTQHGERMQTAVFPFEKVISPFGGVMMTGAPSTIALSMHAIIAIMLAGLVALIWRRVEAWDLRLMTLCAAAPMATPYAFYYELPIFIPPLLLVARRAFETGWLRGERFALGAVWICPLFLPGAPGPGIPLAFLTALAAFAICLRRPFLALKRATPTAAPSSPR